MASFGSVKLEIEDPLEDQHAPLSKRSRLSGLSSLPLDQWSNGSNEFPIPPSQYNPLDEPSPLGLRLRKSPSLLDLIQMKLSQSNASSVLPTSSDQTSGSKKEEWGSATSSGTDKLKASNFCGSFLKIGSWEYVSRYEGDLVAKCYFAKHKIVWEILEGGLKSKIEIQWSDIMGLKADCPDDGPGTLKVVLVRQPLFFRETNPQPRKHTLWQATTDFTGGQASINRQHILRCQPGVLNKHYEKLIMCDSRLHFLSQQPEILIDSPYFESQPSAVVNSDKLEDHGLNILSAAKGSPTVQSIASSPAAGQSSISLEQDLLNGAPEHSSNDASSPSSVMDTCAIEGNGRNLKGNDCWEQLKVSGLQSSMSMTDLVNHIGNCISEQVNSGNMHSNQASECQGMLENIAHILMSDNNQSSAAATSDEKSLMKKVNSLCCLLQDPPVPIPIPTTFNNATQFDQEKHSYEEAKISGEAPTMTRRDSFADLLFQLPRIASLPKFLFDIAEDDANQP